jgi:acetyltransferase
VLIGLGGIYVEVLRDTAARLAPLAPAEARAMLGELRMAPALAGVRGRPPVDQAALADVMCRFAWIAVDRPEIAELEVNPLVAAADGLVAVDARARLTGAPETAP